MADRQFQLTAAERGNTYTGSIDEGPGVCTNDVRVVFTFPTGHYFDITAEQSERLDTIAPTTGGTITGLVRINFDDTKGPDRLLKCLDAIWRTVAARGNAEGWFATPAERDDCLAIFRQMINTAASRWRAEAQIAANG